MAKRKATAEELLAQAESNGYKREPTERKTAFVTTRSSKKTPANRLIMLADVPGLL